MDLLAGPGRGLTFPAIHRDERRGCMGNPSNRALPDLSGRDVRGWDVIAADGVRIGKVRDLVEDRSLEVELDPTTMGSLLRFQADEERQLNERHLEVQPHGGEQLGDVDPTAGVNQTTRFLAPGPRQHTGEHPGAVPRDRKEDTNRGGDAEPGLERHVLIPLQDARIDRDSHQVFLRETRSTDAAALPEARAAVR
jgi:hypothetical protein